jgi:hypothetical protein
MEKRGEQKLSETGGGDRQNYTVNTSGNTPGHRGRPNPSHLLDSLIQRLGQHSGQFLIDNGEVRVSALFYSGLSNEESRVSALVRKSVRTIARGNPQPKGNRERLRRYKGAVEGKPRGD